MVDLLRVIWPVSLSTSTDQKRPAPPASKPSVRDISHLRNKPSHFTLSQWIDDEKYDRWLERESDFEVGTSFGSKRLLQPVT